MRDTPIYPKRGCMSEDEKFYTHVDGGVFDRSECPFNQSPKCATCTRPDYCQWLKRIEGAYVPSDEEQEACEMARKMIRECCTWMWGTVESDDCSACLKFTDRSCPARVYLASKHDPDAWSVK